MPYSLPQQPVHFMQNYANKNQDALGLAGTAFNPVFMLGLIAALAVARLC